MSGISSDQPPHLIPQFLPLHDKISGLISRHHLSSFFFQNVEHGASTAGPFDRLRNSIELRADPHFYLLGPLNLIGGPRHAYSGTQAGLVKQARLLLLRTSLVSLL